MRSRTLLALLFLAAGLVAAAACSSNGDDKSCAYSDDETVCYQVADGGLCGAFMPTGPCSSCPEGTVGAGQCIPTTIYEQVDGGPACTIEIACRTIDEAGICGAESLSPLCEPCPKGTTPSIGCPLDAGPDAADANVE